VRHFEGLCLAESLFGRLGNDKNNNDNPIVSYRIVNIELSNKNDIFLAF